MLSETILSEQGLVMLNKILVMQVLMVECNVQKREEHIVVKYLTQLGPNTGT